MTIQTDDTLSLRERIARVIDEDAFLTFRELADRLKGGIDPAVLPRLGNVDELRPTLAGRRDKALIKADAILSFAPALKVEGEGSMGPCDSASPPHYQSDEAPLPFIAATEAVAEPAFQGAGREGFDQLRRARDYYRQNHPEEVPPPICPQCGLVGIERMPPTQCKYPACGPGCLYEIGRKP